MNRRRFLDSASNLAKSLAIAPIALAGEPKADGGVAFEDWVPGSNYRPGSVVRTQYGNILIGDFQEVLSISGRYLNDHCLVRKGEEWHFFGIVGYTPSGTKGEEIRQAESEISFAHATSFNLRDWKLHPDIIECSHTWPENTHVFAPSVIEHKALYHMLYAVSDQEGTQRICLATSRDLFEWQRYAGNPVIVPSVFWSKWPGFGLGARDDGSYGGCRDPHIIRLDDGRFVAYWVSRLQEKFGKNLVCIAASFSNDLVHWQEIGPVFSIKAWYQQLTLEAESPCVVFKDGCYWLFFKNGWWTYVVRSDSPFDFFGYHPVRLGYSHASEVFFWRDTWWITHCKTCPDDFAQERMQRAWENPSLAPELLANRLRGLYLGKLDWPQGKFPRFAMSQGPSAGGGTAGPPPQAPPGPNPDWAHKTPINPNS